MLKFFINKFYTVHEFDFLDYHIPPGQPGDLPVAAGHGPRAGRCWGLHQLSGFYPTHSQLCLYVYRWLFTSFQKGRRINF
jgi:hypothetical protein